ncbi:MAG: hypothetical protein VR69_12930 [Peptococcaceae bacterium BRH_c4b]|nr:MAG: hypothetical protein VR69_12930 [Peptococcaceae bacterium BRH_c4b]
MILIETRRCILCNRMVKAAVKKIPGIKMEQPVFIMCSEDTECTNIQCLLLNPLGMKSPFEDIPVDRINKQYTEIKWP